jgi:hypothetical protein
LALSGLEAAAGLMFSVRSTFIGAIEVESLIVLMQYNIAAENSGDRDWNAGTN